MMSCISFGSDAAPMGRVPINAVATHTSGSAEAGGGEYRGHDDRPDTSPPDTGAVADTPVQGGNSTSPDEGDDGSPAGRPVVSPAPAAEDGRDGGLGVLAEVAEASEILEKIIEKGGFRDDDPLILKLRHRLGLPPHVPSPARATQSGTPAEPSPQPPADVVRAPGNSHQSYAPSPEPSASEEKKRNSTKRPRTIDTSCATSKKKRGPSESGGPKRTAAKASKVTRSKSGTPKAAPVAGGTRSGTSERTPKKEETWSIEEKSHFAEAFVKHHPQPGETFSWVKIAKEIPNK